jgi:hypothetical protein
VALENERASGRTAVVTSLPGYHRSPPASLSSERGGAAAGAVLGRRPHTPASRCGGSRVGSGPLASAAAASSKGSHRHVRGKVLTDRFHAQPASAALSLFKLNDEGLPEAHQRKIAARSIRLVRGGFGVTCTLPVRFGTAEPARRLALRIAAVHPRSGARRRGQGWQESPKRPTLASLSAWDATAGPAASGDRERSPGASWRGVALRADWR